MSVISVEDLTFSYGSDGDYIFRNVSFRIDTDWKLGFIGRNGRGKTTFLRLLMGEYEYSGRIVSSVGLSLKRKQPPLKVVEIKIFKIQEKSSCGILGVEVTSRNEEKTTGGFYE